MGTKCADFFSPNKITYSFTQSVNTTYFDEFLFHKGKSFSRHNSYRSSKTSHSPLRPSVGAPADESLNLALQTVVAAVKCGGNLVLALLPHEDLYFECQRK